MTGELFAEPKERLADGAVLLRAFCAAEAPALLREVDRVAAASPFRHMTTPGGYRMSVAMTNCGLLGWVSDETGYRYSPIDPLNAAPWPVMPEGFLRLATGAAAEAGFPGFAPDACLVNRYEPGAKLSLHQDKDERDFRAPIVSVSLGLPATFLFGGKRRKDPVRRLPVVSGDVVVWGGTSRLTYHGVSPLADGEHPLSGRCRINLTFRKAG
jgi:alkylated DNA repair protein (DNA oxidative demethylase)